MGDGAILRNATACSKSDSRRAERRPAGQTTRDRSRSFTRRPILDGRSDPAKIPPAPGIAGVADRGHRITVIFRRSEHRCDAALFLEELHPGRSPESAQRITQRAWANEGSDEGFGRRASRTDDGRSGYAGAALRAP